jgi:long-chain fatty acid transport protein
MRKLFAGAVLVFTAVFGVQMAWGGGMSILDVGAKAKGMGGAFRGVADDWSAAYYNPAGLFYVPENQVTFNEVFSFYQFKVNPDVRYGGYNVGYINDVDIYNEHRIISNPTAGGFVKTPFYGRDVVAGFAVFQPYDMNIIWNVFNNFNNTTPLPERQVMNNLDALAMNVVLSTELIEDKLSVGISGGLLKGDLIFNDFFLRPTPKDPSAPNFSQIAGRPNNLLTQWQSSTGDGFGVNFRFGMMYRPTNKLSFGVSYATKSTLTIDGTTAYKFYMPDVPSANRDYFNFPDSIDNILTSGATFEDVKSDFETDVTFPAQLAAGLGYRLNERWLVAGDLEYTFWEDFDGYVFKSTNFDFGAPSNLSRNETMQQWVQVDQAAPVDWDNTLRGSIGIEFMYSEYVTLRGGYSADQSPVKDGSATLAFYDTGLKHSGSLGASIYFEKVTLDLAARYIQYPELTDGSNTDLNNDGVIDNVAGVYEGHAIESILQVTYRF